MGLIVRLQSDPQSLPAALQSGFITIITYFLRSSSHCGTDDAFRCALRQWEMGAVSLGGLCQAGATYWTLGFFLLPEEAACCTFLYQCTSGRSHVRPLSSAHRFSDESRWCSAKRGGLARFPREITEFPSKILNPYISC